MRVLLTILGTLFLPACSQSDTEAVSSALAFDGQCTWYSDEDGDGFGNPDSPTELDCLYTDGGYVLNDDDCDDSDRQIFPGADEICNSLDDNCNGDTDENPTDGSTFYEDKDGDGYGNADSATITCSQPSGFVTVAGDCDDLNNMVRPDAYEYCNELDDDCDGLVDEDVMLTWYLDQDGDGWGIETDTTEACLQPSGYAFLAGDCDDEDPAYNPTADESDCSDPNDYNCDGSVGWEDADADGYPACEDCNDNNDLIFPGASEFCNLSDDDCDGVVDEADADDAATWFMDADGDGHGDETLEQISCYQPDGYVSDASDCNDADASIYPGAPEYCDNIYNDCDAELDEGALDADTWYNDFDGDGYGDAGVATAACDTPVGYVSDASDCDDTDETVHPGSDDYCNGVDDDCDGAVDEDSTGGMFMLTVDTVDMLTYQVDPDNGAITELAEISGSFGINSVAVNDEGLAVGNDYLAKQLVNIDPCTGEVSAIGATGVGNTCGISWGPDGRLYGLDQENDQLVLLDESTGAATVVGSLGIDLTSCGMAYDCANDVLFGADQQSDSIFKIDPVSGEAYDIVETTVPFGAVGLEFDPATGLLYAATGVSLYTVDPTTGATSLVGDIEASNVDDLVYYPECL